MTTELLRLIPTLQSLSIVAENAKFVKKKNKTTKNFIDVGVGNMIGVALTKETADFIGN